MASLTDYFIPEEVRAGTPDELRKARLTIVSALAMFVNSVPNAVVLLAHHVWTVGASVAFNTVMYAAVPWVLKASRSQIVAGHFLVILLWTGMLFTGLFSGGLTSPGLVWWGSTLIFAVMLLGNRVGLFWTVVIVAQ